MEFFVTLNSDVTTTYGAEGWTMSMAISGSEGMGLALLQLDKNGDPSDDPGDAEFMSKTLPKKADEDEATHPLFVDTVLDEDLERIDLAEAGFNNTAVATGDYEGSTIDPSLRGIVSAIIVKDLAGTDPHSLIPQGTQRIMRITLAVTIPEDETQEHEVTLQFINGLKGPGEPVNNAVTYQNESVSAPPLQLQSCVIPVMDIDYVSFIRGDANDDGKTDIADAVRIIHDPRVVPGLGTTVIPCLDAGDANNDGALNLADAVFLINWQYQIGEAPPARPDAPWPGCGIGDRPTSESCPPKSVKICQ